jgi:hypothetical protein
MSKCSFTHLFRINRTNHTFLRGSVFEPSTFLPLIHATDHDSIIIDVRRELLSAVYC